MRPYRDIIRFWFEEHDIEDWFGGKPDFDAVLKAEFAETHAQVARGEAWQWRETPEGRLAELIVLDQFSRQLHRGSPEAFAQDKMALVLAQEAIAAGADAKVPQDWRMFFFMPFQHAESLLIQQEGVRHFGQFDAEMQQYMVDHRDCIARFGRFPFRNRPLGRTSTVAELAYMEDNADRGF